MLSRSKGSILITPLRFVWALCFCVSVSTSVFAQERLTVTQTFEVAGKNMSAGVELINPSAVILDGTRIWIADEGLKKIIVVDERTGLKYEFGQDGSGPGEFRTLTALTRISHSQVAVLDRFTCRVSILELTSQGLSLVKTVPLSFFPSTMCSFSGGLIVTGWFKGKFLHELDESGNIIRSFGDPFRTEDRWRGRHIAIRAHLVCFEQTNSSVPAVVVASKEFGMIRAYGADGVMLWEITPTDFRPIDTSPAPYGGILFKMPREGSYHRISSLLRIDGQSLLVQVETISDKGIDYPEQLTTYLISAPNGEVIWTNEELPQLNYIQDGRALGIENPEYPKVIVYRISPAG